MLQIIVKDFDKLTIAELYSLMQLRSEVFVVEQNCLYQDLDGKDQKAVHILGYTNGNLIAYARIFAPYTYFKEASIGRVVVKSSARSNDYGKEIIKASIAAVETKFNETTIRLSAQTYLRKFYNTFGFKETGKEYLEDEIPHIAMMREYYF